MNLSTGVQGGGFYQAIAGLGLALLIAGCSSVMSPTLTPTPLAGPTADAVITAANATTLGLTARTMPGTFLAWGPAGDYLALATAEGVRLMDVWTGDPIGDLIAIGQPVAAARFSPDGQRLALSPAEPGEPVVLWDRTADGPDEVWNERLNGATSVAFSPDGAMLAAGYPDGTARVWHMESGAQLNVFLTTERLPGEQPVHAVHFGPDSKTLAVFSTAAVLLWDIGSGAGLDSFDPQGLIAGPVATPLFSPGWTYLVWLSRGSVILVDPASHEEVQRFNHQDFVTALSFSPDGRLLITSAYKTVNDLFGPALTVWDVQTGTELNTLTDLVEPPWALAFSPDGRLLAVTVGQQTVLYAGADPTS